MVILIRDTNGSDRAVNLATGGWTAFPVPGNESMMTIELDNGITFNLSINAYDKVRDSILSSGMGIDLRSGNGAGEDIPSGPIPR